MDRAIIQHLNRLEQPGRWWKVLGSVAMAGLSAVLLLGVTAGRATAEAVSAASCFASDKKPRTLTCRLGVEWWKDGKKSPRFRQTWHLSCDDDFGRRSYCSLERMLILWDPDPFKTNVKTYNHSTSDGNLRIRQFDWINWRLSFDVIDPSGDQMSVVLRLKPISPRAPWFLEIEYLHAAYSPSEEWRLPEYSYTMNVPFAIQGKKSADAKALDDMMKKLSTTDRQAFERMRSADDDKCFDFEAWGEQEPLKTLLSPYDEKLKEVERQKINALKDRDSRRLSEAEAESQRIMKEIWQKEEVKAVLHNRIQQCLVEAGMSREGAQLVTGHLLQFLP